MIRLFSPHAARPWTSLDGTWQHLFPRSGDRLDLAEASAGVAVDLEVPGSWHSDLPERREWRGQALVRRTIDQAEAGPAVIHFAGIGHQARVALDGQILGSHHDGHTAFACELAHLAAGRHELVVEVDCSFGAASGLNIRNDYYSYGGINRPVELHRPRRAPWIRRVDAAPRRCADGRWVIACTVRLANPGQAVGSAELRLTCAGAEVRQSVRVPPGGGAVTCDVGPVAAAGWGPASPVLHWLEAELSTGGAVYDGWRDRIGLRRITCAGESILLDDEPIRLLGVNRHEDHGDLGCCLDVKAMRRDLRLIRDLGCNAVRTSHYPNDQRFLDLCDEQGLLVWEENHARGQVLEQMLHPRFRTQALDSAIEMVEQHANHACIAMWGVMNECASETAEGRAMYIEQFAALRASDPSRPVTYASCRHANDICQDLPDICGWNIYPGWYGAEDEPPAACLDGLIARFSATGMAGKPLIISEVGAGGIPGLHDPMGRSKWSLEGQADIVGRQVEALAWHPRVAGLFIWQFCDVRITPGWNAIGRPGGINDKGLVDRWRRPKPAYEVVRTLFRARSAG